MNTPNKLTIARIIATPFFMAALMIDFPFHYTAALILFVAASLTDMIDGKLARKYNMITDFGKFLDPLADKMLTTAAFLGFIKMGIGWQVTWIAFIVLFRVLLWMKVWQLGGIIFALFAYVLISDFGLNNALFVSVCNIIISILFWASAVLCIISGAIYLKDSKEYIDPSK